jgi:cytosine/adenosine deaminase-related metal-dependent hydrolase
MKIFSADFVLPVSSGPIRNGAVCVRDDRIADVGALADIRRRHPEAESEHFAGAALMPGLVNCHSHLELTALRGLLDDLDHDFPAWLLKLTRIRADALSDEDIADSALAGALEGLKSGVTCFGDIGRWGAAGLNALVGARLRGVLFQETEFSPDNRTAKDDFSALIEKTGALSAGASAAVQIGISPHSPYTVSSDLFGMIADHARSYDTKITIHAAESDSEQRLLEHGEGFFADVFSKHGVEWTAPGTRAIHYLNRTGILDVGPLLAHCTKADESEIGVISATGAKIAHCPKSNAKFGHGIAPLSDFLNAGIDVGLGTDSMVSNNLCDLFEEARFAALAARIRHSGARFIQPAEALRMATLDGAEALGLADVTGSLEPGKFADIAVVSLSEVSRMPVHDVNSALLFASRASDVVMTMVGGEELFRDGVCEHADEERLRSRMTEIAEKVRVVGRPGQV